MVFVYEETESPWPLLYIDMKVSYVITVYETTDSSL